MDEQNMPEGMNEQGSAQSNAGADDAPKIDLQKAAPAPMQADVQGNPLRTQVPGLSNPVPISCR